MHSSWGYYLRRVSGKRAACGEHIEKQRKVGRHKTGHSRKSGYRSISKRDASKACLGFLRTFFASTRPSFSATWHVCGRGWVCTKYLGVDSERSRWCALGSEGHLTCRGMFPNEMTADELALAQARLTNKLLRVQQELAVLTDETDELSDLLARCAQLLASTPGELQLTPGEIVQIDGAKIQALAAKIKELLGREEELKSKVGKFIPRS